ncbi:CPBP family intramembrane glutamic endopeptidase [Chitinophaga rhizophila]|uniref:CPBP family intramembrane metalloprotease n=1 Tax=Chitinophaga rhizophila TaxID=2866212 RepID=A0ABS7GDM6_9BACT|nr:CPBP family intramembrane glutamic endopeptidase [Chitinophaga rhizophila]MBW8685265.1 CPBP family intramembrane metalloprotease [Chitinophaga rhizophila]
MQNSVQINWNTMFYKLSITRRLLKIRRIHQEHKLAAGLQIGLPIALAVLYTALIFLAITYVKASLPFHVLGNAYADFQINYQVLLLGITSLSLITSYFLNKERFTQVFRVGHLAAPSAAMKLFGIKAGDSWVKTGLSLTVIISIVTGVFMYFQLKHASVDWKQLQGGIFWIILFSLTNSFSEEMIYRVGIVSPLTNLLSPMTIYIISGIVFGLPHIAGMPSGIIGATMAGVLGLVLAKSLYETQGIFWAWIIHFIQDVIIIGSLYLLSGTAH